MYQDENVSAIVEQIIKHKHRRRGTFHYILQKKNNNIEIFTTYCAKTQFCLLNIRDKENEWGRINHLLQKKKKKKMWVKLTKIGVETTKKCRTDWV